MMTKKPDEQDGAPAPADEPKPAAPAAKATMKEEQPKRGGAFVRQPDGSLKPEQSDKEG